MSARRPSACNIYLVQRIDGAIKVGQTQNLYARLQALKQQFGEVRFLGATPVMCHRLRDAEAIAHDILNEYACGGEWFNAPIGAAVEAVEQASERAEDGEGVPKRVRQARSLCAKQRRRRSGVTLDAALRIAEQSGITVEKIAEMVR